MVTDPVALSGDPATQASTQHPKQHPRSASKAARRDLHSAICELQTALSAAAADPEWAVHTRRHFEQLVESFRDHRRTSEGAGGVYADVLRASPRHAFAVEKLRTEHSAIDAGFDSLGARLQRPTGGNGLQWVEQVRSEAAALLELLTKHRQRSADVLHEAFTQDIGGCE